MIIRRAFYHEAAVTSLAVALVLSLLFSILGATKLLGRAAGGEHSSEIVLRLLGLELLSSLDVLFPLALFVGLLLTVGRWYRDSEMTALAACGLGLWSLLRSALQVGFFFAVAVAVLALYLAPWANTLSKQVKSEGKSKAEIATLTPGVFTELRDSGRIVYVERIRDGSVLENVFVSDSQSPRQNVLVANTGHPLTDATTGEKFLVLENGSLYEGTAGEPDYRVVRFASFRMRLEPKRVQAQAPPVDGLPTLDLLRSGNRRYIAEWHWRVAKPISVFVLVVFALVLAHTDTRRGRVANLFAAILVYFVYTNFLGVGEALLKDGRVPSVLGLWWVHVCAGLMAVYLLARRARNKPLLPIPRIIRESHR